ncbi:hypothetical protein [Aquimarina sp. Aq78]|uniref:hypothetical protein n=1 Tax=Aquimarina sp. Aq78 TaxID=1191889 RepID=UPI000D0E8148|nr:hypothetical protein [Aquimarina sp. Aq78]
MLSDEEKNKIELEEKYRLEIKSKLDTKKKVDLFEKSIKLIQVLAIIIGILFTYLEYIRFNEEKIEKEKERNAQTAKEIRMHFYKYQLDYYAEATDATSTLATEERDSEDYQNARKKFQRLFWGRLAIVEEKTVEAQMVKFKNLLEQYEQPESKITKSQLKQASLNLAHDASRYTIRVWVDSTERNNYNR